MSKIKIFDEFPKGGKANYSLMENMNCPNCNNEIKENQKFCKNCGAALEGLSAPETYKPKAIEADTLDSEAKKADTPAEVVAIDQAPSDVSAETYDTNTAAESDTAENSEAAPTEPQKPQKKFNWKKFLAITVPIVAVLLIIAFNLNLFIGYAVKLFGTPAQYMAYVESKSVSSQVKSSLAFYKNLSENLDFKGSNTTELKLSLSDKGFEVIENLVKMSSGGDISQLEFLKDIGITLETDTNGDISEAKATVYISDNKILSVDCYLDKNENMLYMGIPELSQEYIKIPYSPDMLNSLMSMFYPVDTDISDEAEYDFIPGGAEPDPEVSADTLMTVIKDIMPTEKELRESLTKYIKTALNCVDDAKMDTTDLTVDGITNNVTQITVDIDTDLMIRMTLAVIKDMRNDKNLENILNRAQKSIEENIAPIGEDIYEAFVSLLDEGIKGLEELLENNNFPNESLCVIQTYVNFWHEVVGHALTVNNGYGKQQKYLTATVTNGNEFRSISENIAGVVVSGKGTQSGGVINGDYTYSYNRFGDKLDLFKISYIDFSAKDFENGNLKGSMVITPLEGLINELESELDLDDSVTTLLSLSNLSFRVDLDINRNKAYSAVSILSGENSLITLSLGTEKKEQKSITLPQNTITLYDEDDLNNWIMGFDFSELADNLEKTDIPKEIVLAIRMLSFMPMDVT